MIKRELAFIIVVWLATINPMATFPQQDRIPEDKETLQSHCWEIINGNKYTLHYTIADSAITNIIMDHINWGISRVEGFFNRDFKKFFKFYLFPHRKALDLQWRQDWDIPDFKSQCWMIASGISHRLDFLSPRIWEMEACEHDSKDQEEIKQLICHELVHVYTLQNNPIPDASGLDPIAWFLEGIAVTISGQLDQNRQKGVLDALKKGEVPRELKKAWTGPHRYGMAGSLALYIAQKYGRETLFKLLSCTSNAQILEILGTNEAHLLKDWQNFVINKIPKNVKAK
jgi:hypothetical protein